MHNPSEISTQISDAEKRARAAANQQTQVPFGTSGQAPKVTSKAPPRGHQVHDPQDALRILSDAKDSKRFGLRWDQDHVKGGVSGTRYDRYKHCTTFDEVFDLCEQGTMHGSTKRKIGISGDLNYDFCMGHVRLVPLDQVNGASSSGKNNANDDTAENGDTAEEPDNMSHQLTSTPETKIKSAQKVRRSRRIAAALVTRFAGASVRALRNAVTKMSQDRAKKTSKKRLVNAILDIPFSKTATESEKRVIHSVTDPGYLINQNLDTLDEAIEDYARRIALDNSPTEVGREVFGGQAESAIGEVRRSAARIRKEIQDTIEAKDRSNVHRLSKLAHACVITGTNNPQLNAASDEFAMAAMQEVVCGKITPETMEEAKSLPEWPQWKAALQKEMEALFKMGTFEYCRREDMAPGKKTVRCKWVWKLKVNKDGSIERYKARKVVQGFRLRHGEDYYDTYSPTMGATTLRALVAIATQTGETISGADVGNAYLEADMEDDQIVYVEQDPEYYNPEYPIDDYVLRLKKCLYGMPHSGRAFGQKLDSVLHGLGFRRCTSDKALYYKLAKSGKRIVIGTYVDDIVCMTACNEARDEWREAMNKAFHRVTYDDQLDWILNMEIIRGTTSTGTRFTSLSQKLAIEKLASMVPGIESDKVRGVPMHSTTVTKRRCKDSPETNEHEYNFKFASVIGALMYVANWTRPDLMTSVNRLARYMSDPTDEHYRLAREVAAFAYHTRDRVLTYTEHGDNPLRLSGASDSSFNDDYDHSRSTIGWGLWLGTKCSGMIKWSSKVPKTIATSSTNAEIQAAINLAKDVLWTRTLLADVGHEQHGSTVMYQDNDPAIHQIQDVKGTAMSKHYLVLLRKIQELLHAGIIHMNPIDTKENVADLFTKPLSTDPFWYLSHQAVGYNDADKYGDLLRACGNKYVRSNGGSGKTRIAPSKESLLNALICSIEVRDTNEQIVTLHTGTCKRYPSIHSFYTSMHESDTRRNGS